MKSEKETPLGTILFGLLFFAVGLFVFFSLSLSYIMARTMGVATQGVIERKIRSEMDWEGDISEYLVYYRFTSPHGNVIHASTQLSSGAFSSIREGQSVRVLYVSSYPQYNCLPDYRLWEVRIIGMILFPVGFGGIGFYILLEAFRNNSH